MIKTVKKVIVLTAMIVLGATSVFAQESNTHKATFDQFKTDVDRYFHANDWNKVDFNGFFGYSRFGANIPAGVLDVGAGAKAGSLYIALYYNGKVIGLSDGESYNYVDYLTNGKPGDDEKLQKITLNAKNKVNPKATYGALVGVRDLGFKFTFKDDLEVRGSNTDQDVFKPAYPAVASPKNTNTEVWTGSLTPELQVGLSGKLYRIILGVPIVYNRSSVATLDTDKESVYYMTTTHDKDGKPVIIADPENPPSSYDPLNLFDAEGNYVGVNIGLLLGEFKVGPLELYIDNFLQFNIYGVPGKGLNGKSKMFMGVADTGTFYQPFADNDNPSYYRTYTDSRFWIQDEVTPSFDIVAGEKGKFGYAVNFSMPITFTFVNHSLNFVAEGSTAFSDDLGKKVEVKSYYKQTNFDMELSPRVDAGIQFKPADALSLQGGVGLSLIDWTMKTVSTKEVKAPTDTESNAYKAAQFAGAQFSDNSSSTTFEFDYPNLEFALGFTVNFKKTASLDFVYINKFNPSLAGLVYKAVGEGLGSGDTSLVLSLKF